MTTTKTTTARKHTVFNPCTKHIDWFAGLSRYRTAEVFGEGGPGSNTGCSGAGCIISPGTDLFAEYVCHQTYYCTDPGHEFSWV